MIALKMFVNSGKNFSSISKATTAKSLIKLCYLTRFFEWWPTILNTDPRETWLVILYEFVSTLEFVEALVESSWHSSLSLKSLLYSTRRPCKSLLFSGARIGSILIPVSLFNKTWWSKYSRGQGLRQHTSNTHLSSQQWSDPLQFLTSRGRP